MKKLELANKVKETCVIFLFFSIIVLVLNSLLPIVILKNVDNPDNTVFLNIESMHYSENIVIQSLYNDINLINVFIWLIIVLIFIAFFGIIINFSEKIKKISYLFLILGCLSIIFSCVLCYIYVNFILKIPKFNNISLAYLVVEPIKYSHIIFISIIAIILISIYYVYITVQFLINSFENVKLKKQILTKEKPIEKSFLEHFKQYNLFKNNKEKINQGFYFKKKNKFSENGLSRDIKINKDIDTSHIKKETTTEQINTDKDDKYIDEKKSPFLDYYKKNESKTKKVEKNEVKPSKSLEKALFSAIDKIKKGRN